MAVYRTAAYQVKPSAVGTVTQAIQEFVRYVQANEPGTEMYLAWQAKSDPTKFVHLFMFADADARASHRQVRGDPALQGGVHPGVSRWGCGVHGLPDGGWQALTGRRLCAVV